MMSKLFRHNLTLTSYLNGDPKLDSARITKLLEDFPGKKINKKLFRAEIDGFPYRRRRRRIFSASETEYGAVSGACSMFTHYFNTIDELKHFGEIPYDEIKVKIFTILEPHVILSYKDLVKFHGVEFRPYEKFLQGVGIESIFREKEYLVSSKHSEVVFHRTISMASKKFKKVFSQI